MENGTQDERIVVASRMVDAPAAEIFELIADPARQPEWDGNDNLDVALDATRVRAVGEVFAMRTSKGKTKDNLVVVFEEGRAIGWLPADRGHEPPGHLWRWDLEPVSDSETRVTHTYDWTGVADESRWPRHRQTQSEHLLASIDRLADLAQR
ncbi:MAG TPA: SRPBCC family protein [Propionibacteriaceae bacterium]|nr:SRPBCC family protein [Propionibacteriaceae bacterium]